MSERTFCGRAYPPRRDFILADVVYSLEDLNVLTAWAMANNGKIGINVCRSKNGKPYSTINTYNKNAPGEIPPAESADVSGHRYGKEAMPEPAPSVSTGEMSQEETINEENIPF